jgi:hypothetical protein
VEHLDQRLKFPNVKALDFDLIAPLSASLGVGSLSVLSYRFWGGSQFDHYLT